MQRLRPRYIAPGARVLHPVREKIVVDVSRPRDPHYWRVAGARRERAGGRRASFGRQAVGDGGAVVPRL